MIKFPTLSVIAIIAIFSTITANCEETKTHKQSAQDIKFYEERKEQEQQYIKAVQDEHEDVIEKKIEETEKLKEHIHHKKDSTFRKDEDKRLEHHKNSL